MARSVNTRKHVPRIELPPKLDQDHLNHVMENDEVFQENLRCAVGRTIQGKLSPGQFRNVRRDLVHRALYRHVRSLKLSPALVPKLEAMVA